MKSVSDILDELFPKQPPPRELEGLIEDGDISKVFEWIEKNDSQFLTVDEHPQSPVETIDEIHNLLRCTSPIRLSPYAVGGLNNYLAILRVVYDKLKEKDIPRDYQLRQMVAQIISNLGIEIKKSRGGKKGLKKQKVNRAFLDVLKRVSPQSAFSELERRLMVTLNHRYSSKEDKDRALSDILHLYEDSEKDDQ